MSFSSTIAKVYASLVLRSCCFPVLNPRKKGKLHGPALSTGSPPGGTSPVRDFQVHFASRFSGSPWVTCPSNPVDPSPMGRTAWNSWAGCEIQSHDDLKSCSPGERCRRGLLSEKHLDKRKHHWFIYKPAPALETRGALSPGSECPQLSLFCSCTEIGLKISGHQLSNSSFPFPHSASGKTWASGLNLELWNTLGLGPGAKLRAQGSGLRCWGFFMRPTFLSLHTPSLLHSSPHQSQITRITDLKELKDHVSSNTQLYRKGPEMSRDADFWRTFN